MNLVGKVLANAELALPVERRERLTGAGRPATVFATGFRVEGRGPDAAECATGPFEICATREAVVVRRAAIRDPDELAAFMDATRQAWNAHHAMQGER